LAKRKPGVFVVHPYLERLSTLPIITREKYIYASILEKAAEGILPMGNTCKAISIKINDGVAVWIGRRALSPKKNRILPEAQKRHERSLSVKVATNCSQAEHWRVWF
jgi:hypothetical protein